MSGIKRRCYDNRQRNRQKINADGPSCTCIFFFGNVHHWTMKHQQRNPCNLTNTHFNPSVSAQKDSASWPLRPATLFLPRPYSDSPRPARTCVMCACVIVIEPTISYCISWWQEWVSEGTSVAAFAFCFLPGACRWRAYQSMRRYLNKCTSHRARTHPPWWCPGSLLGMAPMW